jgi:pyrimidine deaminase RibD-like protein
MNINQLESYNLADAVKFHDNLNPLLWDRRENLHPEIHDQLMAIAADFSEFLGVKDLDLKDITISGSNAAYSYTPNSDIDLHLIVDLSNVEHEEVYRELFTAKKAIYNKENTITIKGIPVELYVQDATQQHHSQGIYSLLNSDWIQIPRRIQADIDDMSVRSKYEDLSKRINKVIKSKDLNKMNELMDKIRLMRSAGLAEHGEFGPENLAFKLLRNTGEIQKLQAARQQAKDLELSLKERIRKPVTYGYGKDYIDEVGLTPDGTNPTTSEFTNESQLDEVGLTPDGTNPTTSQFTNETQDDHKNIIEDFMIYCADQLGIDKDINLRVRRDPQWSVRNKTFGRYNDGTNELEVGIGGRHIMDVLRTVAHELVHQKQNQHEQVPMDAGADGSKYENEANAQAGVLMRKYGKLHPELFAEGIELKEASGYIPTAAQAHDPRFEMALTVDVRPGALGKAANAFLLNTDSQGHPQELRPDGLVNRMTEELALFKKKQTTKLTENKLKFSRDKLDDLLNDLCEKVIKGQEEAPDFYGMVAAAVIDPTGKLATGINYLYGNERIHAERDAIDNYEKKYGELPPDCIVVTTLSPCNQDTGDIKEVTCTEVLNKKNIKIAYCGYKDPTQHKEDNDFTILITKNEKIEQMCKELADTFLDENTKGIGINVYENFADGKGPGRPGDSVRHGIPKKATKAELTKASHAKGRKGQLARWQLNMRNGRNK